MEKRLFVLLTRYHDDTELKMDKAVQTVVYDTEIFSNSSIMCLKWFLDFGLSFLNENRIEILTNTDLISCQIFIQFIQIVT